MSFNRKRRLCNPNPVTAQSPEGALVKVLTGRTRGKVMVVMGTFTDKSGKCFAYAADGERYTVKQPKIKAAKHLALLDGTKSELTDEKIRESVSNH